MAIAVPKMSIFTSLSRKAGRNQNRINLVIRGMTTHVKMEDVIRLFTSRELAGDQDCMMPSDANTFD